MNCNRIYDRTVARNFVYASTKAIYSKSHLSTSICRWQGRATRKQIKPQVGNRWHIDELALKPFCMNCTNGKFKVEEGCHPIR